MGLNVYLYFDIDTGARIKRFEVFDANYTHNCGKMAVEAGIYEYVWNPDKHPEITKAADIIPTLSSGIKLMEDNPEKFKLYNPPNGWGDYDRFLSWLKKYLAACIDNPNAKIEVSR